MPHKQKIDLKRNKSIQIQEEKKETFVSIKEKRKFSYPTQKSHFPSSSPSKHNRASFNGGAVFVKSAGGLRDCPVEGWPEVALIGRSNVGKSSLVNMLVGRRALAAVGARPGKTVLMNFFLVGGAWCLVDLPGYGYAQRGRGELLRMSGMLDGYLGGRGEVLRGVVLLVDCRRDPLLVDLDFAAGLSERGLRWGVVFTKGDKLGVGARRGGAFVERWLAAAAERGLRPEGWWVTSARRGWGRDDLLGWLRGLVGV